MGELRGILLPANPFTLCFVRRPSTVAAALRSLLKQYRPA